MLFKYFENCLTKEAREQWLLSVSCSVFEHHFVTASFDNESKSSYSDERKLPKRFNMPLSVVYL